MGLNQDMQRPLISCIVPVHNGESYLAEALDSIRQQTYQRLEIIVVDDGSTDATAELIGSYDQQIRCLRQPHSGPGVARNLGLRAARGSLVAFLDADDLWHPQKLARQLACFTARPSLNLCLTHLQNFWIPELTKAAQRFRTHRFAKPLPGYAPQTVMARRSLFETVGLFDPALQPADDLDWFIRAAEQNTEMKLIPDVLVYRRVHRENVSMEPGKGTISAAMKEQVLHVLKASLDRSRQSARAKKHRNQSASVKQRAAQQASGKARRET